MKVRAFWAATAASAVLASMLVGSVPSSAATPKLPDLGMATITGVRLDETTMPGHKLLRYDSKIINVGAGRFELVGTRNSTNDSLMSVVQNVYDSAGGKTAVATSATMYWAGDGHNHWHVTDLESGEVTRMTGTQVLGSLAKHGFHMIDDEPYQLSLPGAPQSAYYNGTRTANSRNRSSLTCLMGLSVGWMDNYDASTNLQWIDVTGLAAGYYKLTVGADQNGWFEETNLNNNTTWAKIKITAHGASIVDSGGPST
jgi:hypothetical protein